MEQPPQLKSKLGEKTKLSWQWLKNIKDKLPKGKARK
jgi:hypothetical protein